MTEISELKNKRAELIASLLPEDVNDLDPREARMAVIRAENDPSVIAIELDIHAARLSAAGMSKSDIDKLRSAGASAMQRAVQQLNAGA